jgi:hypothetical protein
LQGFVLRAKVHSAKVMDWDAIKPLLQRADMRFPRLKHLWVDAGYRGEGRGEDWVEKKLGDGVWISSSAPASLLQRKCLWHGLSSMAARGRGGRLGEAVAIEGIRSAAATLGGGTLLCLDLSQPRKELRDYERMCASGEALSYMLP